MRRVDSLSARVIRRCARKDSNGDNNESGNRPRDYRPTLILLTVVWTPKPTCASSDPGKEPVRESVDAKSYYVVTNIDQELVPSLWLIVLCTVSSGGVIFE